MNVQKREEGLYLIAIAELKETLKVLKMCTAPKMLLRHEAMTYLVPLC